MTPNALLAAIAVLKARLHQDLLHLQAGHPEALHDLRVGLRQLRSLLKPLEDIESLAPLMIAANQLAARSGMARDEEVLQEEIGQWHPELQAARAPKLAAIYASLQVSPEIAALEAALLQFSTTVSTDTLPGKKVLSSRYREAQRRWRQQLRQGISTMPGVLDPASEAHTQNRHSLRILVKRLRYTQPWQEDPAPSGLMRALRQAQARIGEWHDRHVWIAACAGQAELAALNNHWNNELVFHADSADAALRALKPWLRT